MCSPVAFPGLSSVRYSREHQERTHFSIHFSIHFYVFPGNPLCHGLTLGDEGFPAGVDQ